MSDDLTHKCLAGKACSGSVLEDGVKVPATTAAPDTLCDLCVKGLERAVGELPEMWLLLQNALGDKATLTGQRVSGTRERPIPISVNAEALAGSIVEWLCAAGARVAEVMNTDDPTPLSRITAEHARVITACVNLLQPNIDRLLSSEADCVTVWAKDGWATSLQDMTGIQIGLELVRLHRLSRSLLGHTQSRQQQSLACPLCCAQAVYRTVRTAINGRVYDDVHCDACGKRWTYTDYQVVCGVADRHIREEKERVMAEQQAREVQRLQAELEEARAKAAEDRERLEKVRKLAELEDAGSFDTPTFQRFLIELLEDAA